MALTAYEVVSAPSMQELGPKVVAAAAVGSKIPYGPVEFDAGNRRYMQTMLAGSVASTGSGAMTAYVVVAAIDLGALALAVRAQPGTLFPYGAATYDKASRLYIQTMVTGGVANANGAGGAPVASPTFTGTPAAPTAAVGTNTTQLATTAFVQAATKSKTQTAALVALANPATATSTEIGTLLNAVVAALKA